MASGSLIGCNEWKGFSCGGRKKEAPSFSSTAASSLASVWLKEVKAVGIRLSNNNLRVGYQLLPSGALSICESE